MSDRLPPGTTPQDIDDNFGEPDTDESVVEVVLSFSVEAEGYDKDSTIADALDKFRGVEFSEEVTLENISAGNVSRK